MSIGEVFHNHPGYVIGGGLLAVAAVFLIAGRSGSAAPVGASGPSDASIAAASNYQIASLETGAALQGKQIDQQTTLQHDQDALAALGLTNNFNLGLTSLNDATEITNTNTTAAVENNRTIAGENVANRQISAQEALGLEGFKTQQAQIASGVQIAGIEAQASETNAGYSAATAINASNNNALTTSALIASNAATQQYAAQQASAAQQYAAGQQASAQKQSSSNGLISNIFGAAASILPFLFL